MNTIDIDERKVARNELGLWLGWTIATVGGMLIGFIPASLVLNSIDLGLARILVPVIAGLMIGFLQWLAIRRYVTQSEDWILTAGAAWAGAFAIGLLVIELLGGGLLNSLLAYLLFGVIIALFQWPVLRREIPNALIWVLASVIGWALGAYLSQIIVYSIVAGAEQAAVSGEQAIISFAINGLTGLIAGGITGLALVWLVKQPDRNISNIER